MLIYVVFLLALSTSLCSAGSRPVQRLLQDVPKKVSDDARSQLGSLINVITGELSLQGNTSSSGAGLMPFLPFVPLLQTICSLKLLDKAILKYLPSLMNACPSRCLLRLCDAL